MSGQCAQAHLVSGQCVKAHIVSGQCVKVDMGVVIVLREIWVWSVC